MQIKKSDFIEIEYTGKTKEEDIIFDTTTESVAKEAGIHNPQTPYKPKVVCVGEGQLLKGIDKNLEGKEPGKEYTFEISAEDGFGKKRADLIQLIGTNKFKKHGINPMPGLQVNVDNMMGIIKTVTGGRTLVDFNHPFAGKELIYTVKVNKVVTDTKVKATAMVDALLGNQLVEAVELKESKLEIKTKMEFPKELQDKVNEKIKERVSEVKDISWTNVK